MKSRRGYTSVFEKLIVTLFITLPVIMLITGMLYTTGETYEKNHYPYPETIQDRVIETRVLYNPNCFAYQRPSGRVEPGIIDADNLYDDRLEECLDQEDLNQQSIPLKITIRPEENDIANTVTTEAWGGSVQNPRRHDYVVYQKGKGLVRVVFQYM